MDRDRSADHAGVHHASVYATTTRYANYAIGVAVTTRAAFVRKPAWRVSGRFSFAATSVNGRDTCAPIHKTAHVPGSTRRRVTAAAITCLLRFPQILVAAIPSRHRVFSMLPGNRRCRRFFSARFPAISVRRKRGARELFRPFLVSFDAHAAQRVKKPDAQWSRNPLGSRVECPSAYARTTRSTTIWNVYVPRGTTWLEPFEVQQRRRSTLPYGCVDALNALTTQSTTVYTYTLRSGGVVRNDKVLLFTSWTNFYQFILRRG